MFPPSGAEIYRNEAGEPTGWSMPATAEDYYCDVCGFSHPGDCPDEPEEEED